MVGLVRSPEWAERQTQYVETILRQYPFDDDALTRVRLSRSCSDQGHSDASAWKLDGLINFSAVNKYLFGSRDADADSIAPDLIAPDFDDSDFDVIADFDRLIETAGEYEHDASSRVSNAIRSVGSFL